MNLNWNDVGQDETSCYIKEITAAKILVVDDDPEMVEVLKTLLLSDGFRYVQGTSNSHGALSQFLEFSPDLVLLDLLMPAPDGFQLLRLFSAQMNPIVARPMIVISGEIGTKAKQQALGNGATDYIAKPFDPDDISLRVRTHLRTHFRQRWLYEQNYQLQREVIQRTTELEDYELELRETQIEVTVRLAKAAEHHDQDTGQHTQRVALTCFLLAQELGLDPDFTAVLRRAAPLHDVGKIGIPDTILHKPGKLDVDEWRVMQAHSRIGADLLSGGRSSLLQMSESIALTHHERWNGGGYPLGMKHEAIPMEGRLVAVADVFDALVHDRPYKHAWSVSEALAEIKDQSGRQFDPDVVAAFLKLPHEDLL